jgi:hypothetical protein
MSVTDHLYVEDKGRLISGNVGFEVFTAVVIKSIIFWDMTPYSPLSTRRHIPEDDTLQFPGMFSPPVSLESVIFPSGI